MQFLRTLFWVVVAVIAVIFAMKNWIAVPVSLWGGIVADVKLPVLMLIAFLIGLLPPLAAYQATRWRLRRRIESAERSLAEFRSVEAIPAAVAEPSPFTAAPPADPR